MTLLSVNLSLSPVSLYLSLVSLIIVTGQEDPCTPNPCGENRRCYTSFSGDTIAIACDCLIGHHVPEGGDPFDGCVTDDEAAASAAITTTMKTTSTTRPPTSTLGIIFRESLISPTPPPVTASSSTSTPSPPRLLEGHRPSLLVPRKFGGTGKTPINFIDVDNKENFPEECLVHEDCLDHEFCNEEKCVNTCTVLQNVCGAEALCVASLHRPVCVCPDGFEGEPYVICTKIPSRVGMKFRKRSIST